MTVPAASQKPWIKSVKGDGWEGSWYAEDASNVKDVEKWAAEAKDKDLILIWIHGWYICRLWLRLCTALSHTAWLQAVAFVLETTSCILRSILKFSRISRQHIQSMHEYFQLNMVC